MSMANRGRERPRCRCDSTVTISQCVDRVEDAQGGLEDILCTAAVLLDKMAASQTARTSTAEHKLDALNMLSP